MPELIAIALISYLLAPNLFIAVGIAAVSAALCFSAASRWLTQSTHALSLHSSGADDPTLLTDKTSSLPCLAVLVGGIAVLGAMPFSVSNAEQPIAFAHLGWSAVIGALVLGAIVGLTCVLPSVLLAVISTVGRTRTERGVLRFLFLATGCLVFALIGPTALDRLVLSSSAASNPGSRPTPAMDLPSNQTDQPRSIGQEDLP